MANRLRQKQDQKWIFWIKIFIAAERSLKQFFSMYTGYKDYARCIPAHMQPTMILVKLIDDEEM